MSIPKAELSVGADSTVGLLKVGSGPETNIIRIDLKQENIVLEKYSPSKVLDLYFSFYLWRKTTISFYYFIYGVRLRSLFTILSMEGDYHLFLLFYLWNEITISVYYFIYGVRRRSLFTILSMEGD